VPPTASCSSSSSCGGGGGGCMPCSISIWRVGGLPCLSVSCDLAEMVAIKSVCVRACGRHPRWLAAWLQRPRARPSPAGFRLAYAGRFHPWRSILTEIYLCHACSCHEILRMETPGQGRLSWLWRPCWRHPAPVRPPPAARDRRCGGGVMDGMRRRRRPRPPIPWRCSAYFWMPA
jgi:hypothetical protein